MKHGATHLNLVELSKVLDERYPIVKHHTNDLIRYHADGLSLYFRLGDIDKGWLAKIKFLPDEPYVKVLLLKPTATVEYPSHKNDSSKMEIYSYTKDADRVSKISWFEKSLDIPFDDIVWLCFPPKIIYINNGSPYYLSGDVYPLEDYEKEKNNRVVSPDLIHRWFEVNVEKVYVLIEEYESFFDKLDRSKTPPIPILRDIPSMLEWVEHIVTDECLDENGFIKRNSQIKIIKMSYEYGFKDGTQVKKAWATLKYETGKKPLKHHQTSYFRIKINNLKYLSL